MNKQLVKDLTEFAKSIAKRFSYKDRAGNVNLEDFMVVEVIPMSDASATVIYEKNTGKRAAFFFYYISKGKSEGWKYFVPTDSHILGMQAFSYYKLEVERFNYIHNF